MWKETYVLFSVVQLVILAILSNFFHSYFASDITMIREPKDTTTVHDVA